jgi:hypothetical protein
VKEVKKKQRQKGKKGMTRIVTKVLYSLHCTPYTLYSLWKGMPRIVTKMEPCESFFQFFVPPEIPTEVL